MSYIFLQEYWWFILSLLAGILVFLLFVQGGQSILFCLGRDEEQKNLIINAMGHKWELTFTTLVTFGGAFFASFPLFYSTSFGGAIYVWLAILVCFILQAVSYEFRKKKGNFLGAKVYEIFLVINGVLGTILLGTAVGTLFTGGNFIVNPCNIVSLSGSNIISEWQNGWHGLEAVTDYRNVALGLAVFFLSRVLGIQYLHNSVDSEKMKTNSKKIFLVSVIGFLICFLTFVVSILLSKGLEQGADGIIYSVDYKYFNNLIAMPIVAVLFLAGVVLVLYGIALTIFKGAGKAIWFSGIGTVITVTMLMLLAGYNNTAYYPSLVDMQSSLTITNSSSSHFTLSTMTYASILIPFVLAYIWYAWREMNKKKISTESLKNDSQY